MRAPRRRSSLHPESKKEGRPEQPPPVADPPHLRVSLRGVIPDGHRVLHDAVPAPDDLEENVRLQVVAVQPGLVQVDRRVAQELRPEDAEPVRGVRDAVEGEDAEDHRVDPGPEPAPAGGPHHPAAAHPARALDVVRLAGEQVIECADKLFRLVLIVTGDQGEVRPPTLKPGHPPVADGGPRAASPVSSVDPSSTTIASKRPSRGILSRTRPIFPASLSAGMITATKGSV